VTAVCRKGRVALLKKIIQSGIFLGNVSFGQDYGIREREGKEMGVLMVKCII